jgi:hypothetical protein
MQTRPLFIRVRAIRHGHPFWRRPALSPRLIIRPLPGPRLGPPVPPRNPGGPERGFLGTGTVNVRGWQTIHHDAWGPQALLAQGQTANRETVKPPCPASGRFCERTPRISPAGSTVVIRGGCEPVVAFGTCLDHTVIVVAPPSRRLGLARN